MSLKYFCNFALQQSHTTYLQEVKEDKTETTKKFTMPSHPKAQLSGTTVKCADGELALITLCE